MCVPTLGLYRINTDAGVRADSMQRNKVKPVVGGSVCGEAGVTSSENRFLPMGVRGQPPSVNKENGEKETPVPANHSALVASYGRLSLKSFGWGRRP